MPKVEDDTLELLKGFQIPKPREGFASDIVMQAKQTRQNRILWLNPLRQLRAFFHIPRFRQLVVYSVVLLAISIGLITNPPGSTDNTTPTLAALDAEALYVESELVPDMIFASMAQEQPTTTDDPLSDIDFGDDAWIERL